MTSYEQELRLLYGAACDGLRQESRKRALMSLLADNSKISISEEREVQLAASIALQWRLVGFHVELDSYASGSADRRPDFGIWLPVTKQYMFLELKETWPGFSEMSVLTDIRKLDAMFDGVDQHVGLLTVGFALCQTQHTVFETRHRKLSEAIVRSGEYTKLGLKRIELHDFDDNAPYAWVGMWIHNLRNETGVQAVMASWARRQGRLS